MMRTRFAGGDEARNERVERHRRIEYCRRMALQVGVALELVENLLRVAAIGRTGGLLMAHAIDIEVGPPDPAAFVEAHRLGPSPLRCWRRIQRTTCCL